MRSKWYPWDDMSRIQILLLVVLGVFGAHSASAALKEGETCQITEFPQKIVEANKSLNPKLVVISATCQKSVACDANAPMITLGSSEPKIGRIHQYVNSGGCDEAAGYGCCIYMSEPSAPGKPAVVNPGSSMKLDNPLGTNSLLEVVRRSVQTFVGVLGAFALLVMIYAGFTWMTAGGDTSRVQKAQQTIRYAVIGLGMIIFSYAIVSFGFRAITGS
jgi:hypothetical protein